MSFVAILTHPFINTSLKMLALFLMLVAVSKLRLSANRKANIWRVGLVLLVFLPVFNQVFPVLQLPIVPTYSSDSVVNDSVLNHQPMVDQMSTYQSLFNGFIWPLMMGLSLISLVLLVKIKRQLRRLKQLTDDATPVVNEKWLKQARHLAKQIDLKHIPLVLQSKQVKSPSTWGYTKPVILLPDLVVQDDRPISNDLQLVLLHELAHIKRRDWLWMMVAKITTAMFWFNPLMWLLKDKLINSFEQASDEMVLEQAIQPSQYVETLLHFHNQQVTHFSNLTTGMAQNSAMYKRLQHILNPLNRRHRMNNNKQNIISMTATVTMILVCASQLSLAHQSEHGTTVMPNSQTKHVLSQTPVAPELHVGQSTHPTPPPSHSQMAASPQMYKAPAVDFDRLVQPTPPAALSAPAHSPVVAPAQAIKPETPRSPHTEPNHQGELQLKLKSAEARIRHLESRLAEKKAHAQQRLQEASEMTQEQKKQLTEMKLKRSETVRLKQQARWVAEKQEIHAKVVKLRAQAQQARQEVRSLAKRIQVQPNSQH